MSDDRLLGWHSVQAVLAHHPHRVREIFLQKDHRNRRVNDLLALTKPHHIPVHFIPRQNLDRKADGHHQGVMAYVNAAPVNTEQDLWRHLDQLCANHTDPFLLILDGITDPHNLGACLRSADAAGVHAVIVPEDKSAHLGTTAAKVACGAADTLFFAQVTNLARVMKTLKQRGIWLMGAAGEASQALYQADLSGPIAWVMGSEGKGLRRLTREHCDYLLHIPMAGKVDSLNVSVATGICLFETLRQKNRMHQNPK